MAWPGMCRLRCGRAARLAGANVRIVVAAVKRQVSKFSFKVLGFTFTDIGLVRSLRIISHNPIELSEG